MNLEMPRADAEALLRFVQRVDVQKECPTHMRGDGWKGPWKRFWKR